MNAACRGGNVLSPRVECCGNDTLFLTLSLTQSGCCDQIGRIIGRWIVRCPSTTIRPRGARSAALSAACAHPCWNLPMSEQPSFEQQSHYDKSELVACGRGELFGPGNAQLPMDNMLMVDRVTHISSTGGEHDKGEIIAELDIHPDLWFFACHFPGDPVMPGCLGLDAMWQLVGFFLGWRGNPGRGRALGSGDVKFTGQILPSHSLVRYHIQMKRVIERKLVMGIADGSVSVDGEIIYTAADLRVGLFQNTDTL